MKEYLFIFRGCDNPLAYDSAQIMQDSMMKWQAWIESIAAKGKYITGQPLLPEGKVVNGKRMKITDGPFAEGKELVGGYFLIKAENMDDALEISKGCPGFEFEGSVEIREILAMHAINV
jgi:hypothetical protein